LAALMKHGNTGGEEVMKQLLRAGFEEEGEE
jgi:hypothetical protein